jgi:SAM-dependent methyltransferase
MATGRADGLPDLRCLAMTSSRSARVFTDFLLPHLTTDMHLVDVACGSGELSLELAAEVGRLTGIDDDPAEIEGAGTASDVSSTRNANFMVGDAYSLPLPDGGADAVLGHSVLEALDRPAEALAEMRRILKTNGVVAVASVEYGGLILTGPHEPLIRRFFDIRQKLWLCEGAAPFRGRELRGLLMGSGFGRVQATTKSICYGTEDAVREFGLGRADDCIDDWYVEGAQRERLATLRDLATLREAWLEWAESSASYAAFAWCRALGWKV